MSASIQADTFPYYTGLHYRRRWAPLLAGAVPGLVVVIQEWTVAVVSALLQTGAVNAYLCSIPTSPEHAFLESARGCALYSRLTIVFYLGP